MASHEQYLQLLAVRPSKKKKKKKKKNLARIETWTLGSGGMPSNLAAHTELSSSGVAYRQKAETEGVWMCLRQFWARTHSGRLVRGLKLERQKNMLQNPPDPPSMCCMANGAPGTWVRFPHRMKVFATCCIQSARAVRYNKSSGRGCLKSGI
ncbi:hypothetical protein GX48_06738 [Paracoccidioides brasiliensis]|nr:hypothetical protein GX48_06738 [Paracoccidioides brasiliensis]